MGPAIALVRTFLNLNGFFTVTEFPILGGGRVIFDLDVAAVRFPGAGSVLTHRGEIASLAPELGIDDAATDILLGQVHAGPFQPQSRLMNAPSLRAALDRLGCCARERTESVVEAILERGQTTTRRGFRIRLFSFVSGSADAAFPGTVVRLSRAADYVRSFVTLQRQALQLAELRDPALSLFVESERVAPTRRPAS